MSSDSNEVVLVHDDQMYQVEAIRGKRKVGNKVQYLVKWLGWDEERDLTWEPPENLTTVKDLIRRYQQSRMEQEGQDDRRQSRYIDKQIPKKQIVNEKKKLKQKERNQEKKQRSSPRKLQKPIKKEPGMIELSSHGQQAQQSSQMSSERKINSTQERKKLKIQKNSNIKNNRTVGNINRISVHENGETFYQVDILNKNGECLGVKLLSSEEIKERHNRLLVKYLEDYIKDDDRYNLMLKT